MNDESKYGLERETESGTIQQNFGVCSLEDLQWVLLQSAIAVVVYQYLTNEQHTNMAAYLDIIPFDRHFTHLLYSQEFYLHSYTFTLHTTHNHLSLSQTLKNFSLSRLKGTASQ